MSRVILPTIPNEVRDRLHFVIGNERIEQTQPHQCPESAGSEEIFLIHKRHVKFTTAGRLPYNKRLIRP